MRTSTALPFLGAALAGRVLADDAQPVTDNPVGVVYQAVLPEEPFFADAAIEGNVKGSITAVSRENGSGVRFHIQFQNLPAEGGPFTYHIHTDKVVDGNCTVTLTHLDPFNAGVEVPCDAANPASCEVGDLSGKHGKVESDPFDVHYIDAYASTKEGIESFFGDRSFVLHYANSTRLTCANFELKKMAEPLPSHQGDNCTAVETPAPTYGEDTPPAVTDVAGGEDDGEDGEGGEDDGKGDDSVVVPPPSDGGATPTPSDGSAGNTDVPVPAAAAMQHLSVPLLFLGLAAVLFTG